MMVDREKALRGRAAKHARGRSPRDSRHADGRPFPGMEMALFGMGCFWGAEKGFWLLPGVHSTSVGYAGGYTPNASYEEVCSGQTGHTEVVRVVFDPKVTSYDAMLKQFWEGHDPTQGMRQGARYRHAVSFGDLLLLRRAAPGRRAIARCVSEAADGGGIRADHDGNRAGARVLLRRGLPPAIPRQESARILRPRRDGRCVSGRRARPSALSVVGVYKQFTSPKRIGNRRRINREEHEKSTAHYRSRVAALRSSPWPAAVAAAPAAPRAAVRRRAPQRPRSSPLTARARCSR